jgi:hypothetical protein
MHSLSMSLSLSRALRLPSALSLISLLIWTLGCAASDKARPPTGDGIRAGLTSFAAVA